MSGSIEEKVSENDEGVTENPAPRTPSNSIEADLRDSWEQRSGGGSGKEKLGGSHKRTRENRIKTARSVEGEVKGYVPVPREQREATKRLDESLKTNRQHLDNTIKRVNVLHESVSELKETQEELNRQVTELSDQLKRIDAVEVELNEFELEISERVTQLEDNNADMEQAEPGGDLAASATYPSFASFSFRVAIIALLFITLFWTFYTQGVIGGLVFGALSALLVVIGLGSALTWYQLKN